ncbi:MAG: hypothetical protein GF401_10335 [Chitinivibrionales bacterium]|nr:hypothetical protein [Chitinivibrionales bacterium]
MSHLFNPILISLISFIAIILCSCSRSNAPFKHTFYRMDTIIRITLVAHPDDKRVDSTWTSIDSLLRDWEERFSQTHERSEVFEINTLADDSCAAIPSPVLGEMLYDGLRYGDTLDGMFDITILPVKKLWGFGENDQKQKIPDSSSLKKTLERTGYHSVWLSSDKDTICFGKNTMAIDVGGIAKGFVLREISLLLKRRGDYDYLIEAGGDILVHGERSDGSEWRIGVRHPRESELLVVFPLDSGCVVTSGDYERVWFHEGRRIHHIFNPHTGYPCSTIQSLTVWSMDPVEADIVSTGLFCYDKDFILSFIETRPRFECIIVDSGGEITVSDGWKRVVELK